MAIEQNIDADDDFFIGEDKSLSFTIYQSDGSTPQNITGWTISWMLKLKATDTDAAAKITKTTASGIALTTPASGVCTVTIADTDTDAIRADTYFHELKRMDAGFETILSFGACELRQSKHRA